MGRTCHLSRPSVFGGIVLFLAVGLVIGIFIGYFSGRHSTKASKLLDKLTADGDESIKRRLLENIDPNNIKENLR